MPKGEGRGTHEPGKRDDTTEQELEFFRALEWWLEQVSRQQVAIDWWVDNRISPEQP